MTMKVLLSFELSSYLLFDMKRIHASGDRDMGAYNAFTVTFNKMKYNSCVEKRK